MAAAISGTIWSRLCRSTLDEDRLHRWLSKLAPSERRAFCAAVLLIDGKASVSGVVEGWALLDLRRPEPVEPVEEPVREPARPGGRRVAGQRTQAGGCRQCGAPLPEYEAEAGGRPFWYCSDECRLAARRAARRKPAGA